MIKQQQLRKARTDLLMQTIKALEPVEYFKLVGLMSLNYGQSSDLTKKYLQELKDAEFILVNNGIITTSEQIKALQNAEIKKAEIEVKTLEKEMLEPI
jgi:hypothetical protein